MTPAIEQCNRDKIAALLEDLKEARRDLAYFRDTRDALIDSEATAKAEALSYKTILLGVAKGGRAVNSIIETIDLLGLNAEL